ncbi:MAG: DNA polymerase III subunit delta [Syntrophobacteraceae bacterium]
MIESENFLKALKSGKIDPVYLFVGTATFLMGQAWKELLSTLLPKGAGRFNGERLQARETDSADLISRLAVVPMFGGRRLIMVDNVEAWGKAHLGAIEAFVQRIASSACLVMTAASRKSVEPLAKAVEARGKVVQFRPPGEKEAPRWVMERASQIGKTISHKAAFLLVEAVGTDLQTLASELEKICTFAGERKRIEPEDVVEAAGSYRSYSTFDLLDNITGGRADKAFSSLRSLIVSGEPPLRLLATLAGQLRLIWQVKDGLRQTIPEAQLIKRTGAHPYVVKKAIGLAGRFTDAYLYKAIESVGQTDIAIKSTGSAPELLLEDLVLKLVENRE